MQHQILPHRWNRDRRKISKTVTGLQIVPQRGTLFVDDIQEKWVTSPVLSPVVAFALSFAFAFTFAFPLSFARLRLDSNRSRRAGLISHR